MSSERKKPGNINSKPDKGEGGIMPDGCTDIDNQAFATIRASLMGSLPTLVSRESRETEERFLPCCDDPKIYLQTLRNTNEYRVEISTRMKETQVRWAAIASQYPGEMAPTEEDVKAVFEESPDFKSLFWDFEQDVLHLKYNPKKMSKDFNKSFANYRIRVRASLEEIGKGSNVEAMRQKDLERSSAHDKVAAVLVQEGVAETEFIARAVVRAFLIDVGEDYLQSARQADALRGLRNLSDRRAVAKFLSDIPDFKAIRVSKFTPERAQIIRESFRSNQPESYNGEFPQSKAFKMPIQLSVQKSGD